MQGSIIRDRLLSSVQPLGVRSRRSRTYVHVLSNPGKCGHYVLKREAIAGDSVREGVQRLPEGCACRTLIKFQVTKRGSIHYKTYSVLVAWARGAKRNLTANAIGCRLSLEGNFEWIEVARQWRVRRRVSAPQAICAPCLGIAAIARLNRSD